MAAKVKGRLAGAGWSHGVSHMLRSRVSQVVMIGALALTACSGKQERLANYMKRGEEYLAAENYDKARVEFGNALQIDPNNARARFEAGRVAEKQTRIREAVGNYQAAIDLDPKLVAARAALGRAYLLGGLADKARETIEPALAIAPQDPDLLVVSGSLKAMNGDQAGAVADGETAVKSGPENELAVAYLAAQYRRSNRLDDAIKLVDAAVQRLPRSIDLRVILAELLNTADRADEAEKRLREITTLRPKDLPSWQRLAGFYQLRKRPADAEAALRSAVTAMPESVEAKSALVSFVAGTGGIDKARAQILQFVEAAPKDQDLRLALGQFYESTRDEAKAEAEYRGIITAEGAKLRGLTARDRLAAMMVRRNQPASAEQLIAEVLTANARDNDALVLRAGIALSRGQTSTAITDLRSVLRDQPQSQPIMRALARAHLQDNDFALAEEMLRAAVQVNPADQQTRLELAELLARSGRPKLAQPLLEQLGRELPNNLPVRVALAEVLTMAGDLKAAIPVAEEVKRLHPEQATGYMLAGGLLEAQGKPALAQAEYEHALKVADDPVTALTALAHLDISQKQPQRAQARVAEYVNRNPTDARALNLQGELLASLSKLKEAAEAFSKATAAKPDWWLPYRGLARTLVAGKQVDQALVLLKDADAKTHESPEARFAGHSPGNKGTGDASASGKSSRRCDRQLRGTAEAQTRAARGCQQSGDVVDHAPQRQEQS